MRGSGIPILILLAIVGGLVWAFTWGPLRDASFFGKPAQNTALPVTPAGEAAAPAVTPPKARSGSVSTKESRPDAPTDSAAATAQGAPVAVAQAPPPAAPARFPTAVDVPIGTLGSTVVDSFGPPSARTTSVDERGLFEAFIYRRSRPDTSTVIHIRNGRVIAAVTTAY